MKRTFDWLSLRWRSVTVFTVLTSFVASLLWFHIGSLLPGKSPEEAAAWSTGLSYHDLLNNPLFLPHKIIDLVLALTHYHSLTLERSVSAAFGLFIVFVFYRILRTWYTTRMAILGTLLFATSSWFLHTARFATPEILFMMSILLLWCGLRTRTHAYGTLTLPLCAVVGGILLYLPGLVWVVLGLLIWQFKTIRSELRQAPIKSVTLTFILGIIIISPLLYGLAMHPNLLKAYAGLPESLPSLQQFGLNLGRIPMWLFVKGPGGYTHWLSFTPILDTFSAAMFLLGLYGLVLERRYVRSKLAIGILALGSVLVALGGMVTLSLVMPFVYILITAGVAFMLRQWFTVFPRNPVARAVGASLMSAAILLVCFYHISHYYIAWPNTPETKQAFNSKP